MSGWIKLHRKILQSDMYKSLNSKQRDVVITILLMANHKENQWEYKGEIYTAGPGQFVTSLESIRANCAKDVSIKNIRTALEKLETWSFLANQSTKTGRLITVVNWEVYQSEEEKTAKTSAEDRQRGGKEPATNKNVKNGKNEKKKDSRRNSSDDTFSKLINEIWEHYLTTFDGFFPRGLTLTDKRRNAIQKRLEDGKTASEINLAVSNIRKSKFHCGDNPNSKFYADITFVCRDTDKVEEWMNYQPEHPKTKNNVTPFRGKQEGVRVNMPSSVDEQKRQSVEDEMRQVMLEKQRKRKEAELNGTGTSV